MQPPFVTRRRTSQAGDTQGSHSAHSVTLGRLSKEATAIVRSLLREEKHEVGGTVWKGRGRRALEFNELGDLWEQRPVTLSRKSRTFCRADDVLLGLGPQVPATPALDISPSLRRAFAYIKLSSFSSGWFLFMSWAAGRPAFP